MADTKNWTWVLERRCPDCGFDARALDRADIAGATRAGGRALRRAALAGDGGVYRPPGPGDLVGVGVRRPCARCVRGHARPAPAHVGARTIPPSPTGTRTPPPSTSTTRPSNRRGSRPTWWPPPQVLADAYAAVADDQWARRGLRSDGSSVHRRVARPLHGARPRPPRLGRRAGLRSARLTLPRHLRRHPFRSVPAALAASAGLVSRCGLVLSRSVSASGRVRRRWVRVGRGRC